MASLPPVILDTHENWFNLLMTVLHQQAEQNPFEEYREMAQKLIGQFMRYGRPFVDSSLAPAWRFGCIRRRPEIPSGSYCFLFAITMIRIEITAQN